MKSILQAHLEEYQSKLFEWGQADCYTLASEYINKQFPENKLLKLEYSTEKEAYRFNLKHNWFTELNKSFEKPNFENSRCRKATILYEQMTYITNCSKWEAAKKWAKSHDTEFIILTEKDLKINNSKK